MTSMNWDDLKFFLAVSRKGSIRAAAKELGVNHATVSRRINNFEASLNQRLFERTASGYMRTEVGEEIFEEARHLEERLNRVACKVAAKDKALTGDIRVTLPDLLAQEFLMEDFAIFAKLYPDINLEIIDSIRSFNLINREADVAFRLCDEAPEHLVGRKLGSMFRAGYIHKRFQHKIENPKWLAQQNWIGWSDKMPRPIGVIAEQYAIRHSRHFIESAALQHASCKEGMGISLLPCFVGDKDPDLIRVPPYVAENRIDLWILSHPDMRKNPKIKTFVRFMTERILEKRPLIEGELFEISTL